MPDLEEHAPMEPNAEPEDTEPEETEEIDLDDLDLEADEPAEPVDEPDDQTYTDTPEEADEPDDVPTPEQMLAKIRRPFRIRAEHVMGFIALLALGVLIAALVFALPRMTADEDPEDLSSFHDDASEPPETILEPTESATEPENPTVPPDKNPYDRYDFQYNKHNYLLLQNLTSYAGVDVSAYQGEIDWQEVAASGISFAIIRLGYRGYGSGKLVEDSCAQANLLGAKTAGLKVGAYFFSQALNEQEVDEEIDFMLEVLGDTALEMPIVLDWEVPTSDARTAGKMDAESLTALQLYFCDTMSAKGYQPMVYFNWHQSENLYVLHDLEDYPFWLALYQDRMTYPWKVEMWQYTSEGKVPGINAAVDLDVYMP